MREQQRAVYSVGRHSLDYLNQTNWNFVFVNKIKFYCEVLLSVL